jgi:hypothetical protein
LPGEHRFRFNQGQPVLDVSAPFRTTRNNLS